MKSSLQRQIRNKILEQYPYLSQPALPLPKALAPTVEDSDDSEDEDLGKRKKGAGKEKKSKKEAKGGKKGRKGQAAEEPEEPTQQEDGAGAGSEEETLTVMDTLWPKKEGCSLVKWYVHPLLCIVKYH